MSSVNDYIQLMRLNKPIGLFLLLWPTLWGLLLAGNGHPHASVVVIFILGVLLMRSAGCVINDFADRRIDKHVARTRERPVTAGKIPPMMAVMLFFVLSAIAFSMVFFLNEFTRWLAVMGGVLAFCYPFLKRVTHLPQIGLGLAFAWGVPMSFAALHNHIPWAAWELFVAAALWPVVYDTMYAMVDRDDDIKINVKSTAILFGHQARVFIGVLQLIFLLIMWDVGRRFQLKSPYFMALLVVGVLFVYQLSLLKGADRERCFNAFLNNQWVGMIIFIGILASYL